jgi:hypothetical protein
VIIYSGALATPLVGSVGSDRYGALARIHVHLNKHRKHERTKQH